MSRLSTRPFSSCVLAAILSVPVLASSQPSPPPQAAPTPLAPPGAIQVDVVVADAQHKPVHALTASDFIVLENGHPQTINTFEEHNSWEAAAPVMQPPDLPPGTFTNFSIAPASGSVNVLLLDMLNTPVSAQNAVRDEVLKYLKQVHPGTRMAVFCLTSRLVLLQGFTSDIELLSDVANGKVSLPKPPGSEPPSAPAGKDAPNSAAADASTPDSSSNDAAAPIQSSADDYVEPSSSLGNIPSASALLADLKQIQAATQSSTPTARAHYTLDALNLLAHSLGNLPGRKNLIWFSGSFPINILPDGDAQDPFGALASAVDEYRETSALLSQSKVAVYPVQATAGSSAPKPETTSPLSADGASSISHAMAQATGGEVVADSGSIQDAIEKAIQTGSHYYTLSYTPTGPNEGGDFRKIRVDTSRQNLTLEYRHGYFGGSNAPRQDQASAAGQIPFSAMRIAMGRGGPNPTEVIFTASVFPVAGNPEPDPAPGNRIGDKAQAPFRRYAVQLGIDAHDITCPTNSDGAYQCTLEASMTLYDDDGNELNSAGGTIQATIPTNQFANILRDGLSFRQDISVPLKSDSFLRIGIHEPATNKIGTVEFPISAVSKLKPIPVTPAATSPQPAPQP